MTFCGLRRISWEHRGINHLPRIPQTKQSIFAHVKRPQKAFYRQISQSTIADTGYKLCDILRLNNSSTGSLSVEKLPSLCETQNPQRPYNDIDRDQRNAKYAYRNCKNNSLKTYLSIRRKAEEEARRRPSTFKNTPFLHVEDALLEARKAFSLILYVTF